jgi:hypothetical protein
MFSAYNLQTEIVKCFLFQEERLVRAFALSWERVVDFKQNGRFLIEDIATR